MKSLEVPASDPTRYLYTADCAHGRIGLSLPAVDPGVPLGSGRRVLDAALVLADAEPWLAAFEAWLGQGLLPSFARDLDASPERWMFDTHVCVQHPQLDSRVYLPLEWLIGNRSAPPQLLHDWVWSPIECELLLDAPPIARYEAQELDTGDLLLLPSSFASPWTGRLIPRGSATAGVLASIGDVHGRLSVSVLGGVPDPLLPGQTCVFLDGTVSLMPSVLFSWSSDAAGKAVAVGDAVILCSLGSHDGGLLASGELIPMAQGWAVRIVWPSWRGAAADVTDAAAEMTPEMTADTAAGDTASDAPDVAKTASTGDAAGEGGSPPASPLS